MKVRFYMNLNIKDEIRVIEEIVNIKGIDELGQKEAAKIISGEFELWKAFHLTDSGWETGGE
jgi:hypothetical protein